MKTNWLNYTFIYSCISPLLKAQCPDRVEWLILGHVLILVRGGQGDLVCIPTKTTQWVKEFPNEKKDECCQMKDM